MNKFILSIFLLLIPATVFSTENAWQTLLEVSSPDLIVSIQNIASETYRDPNAKLYLQIKRNKDMSVTAMFDVSHKDYPKKFYGHPRIDFAYDKDGHNIITFQCRYGGDGDHSENLLKLFKFQDDKGTKLLDQNIDSVEFIQENGILKQIKGRYVATLCQMCDGWEVSLPEDIFFVPIVINIESLSVKSTLNEKEKKELIRRLDQQAEKDIAEQLSYGNKKYPTFVSKVKAQIKELLGRK